MQNETLVVSFNRKRLSWRKVKCCQCSDASVPLLRVVSPHLPGKWRDAEKGRCALQDWAEAVLQVVTSNWEVQPLSTAQVTDNSIQVSFSHFSTAHKTFLLALSWVVAQINSLQHSGRGRGMEGHSAASYPTHRKVPVHITMDLSSAGGRHWRNINHMLKEWVRKASLEAFTSLSSQRKGNVFMHPLCLHFTFCL